MICQLAVWNSFNVCPYLPAKMIHCLTNMLKLQAMFGKTKTWGSKWSNFPPQVAVSESDIDPASWLSGGWCEGKLRSTSIAMKNGTLEDVFPIKKNGGDSIAMSVLVDVLTRFLGVYICLPSLKLTARPWQSRFFPGKCHQNGGCSMAMYV